MIYETKMMLQNVESFREVINSTKVVKDEFGHKALKYMSVISDDFIECTFSLDLYSGYVVMQSFKCFEYNDKPAYICDAKLIVEQEFVNIFKEKYYGSC